MKSSHHNFTTPSHSKSKNVILCKKPSSKDFTPLKNPSPHVFSLLIFFYSCTRYKLLCDYNSSSSSDNGSEEE